MSTLGAVCDPLSLSAALAVGVAGSTHCLAMCGGVAGALGLRAQRSVNARRAWLLCAVQQLGRLSGYALVGALVGAFGGLLQLMIDVDRLALLARLMTGGVLLAIGAGVVFRWRPVQIMERVGGHLWRHAVPLLRALPADGFGGAFLLGMLWGWLPCGFVYSMLIFAALKGGMLQSAALMFCFGAGTAPAVLCAGALSGRIGRLRFAREVHRAAGCLVILCGALTLLGPAIAAWGPALHPGSTHPGSMHHSPR